MTKEDTPLPLLSDDDLRGLNRAQGIHYMQDGEHRFNRIMGASEVRDFYEPHILSRDAKIKSLEGLVQELVDRLHFEHTASRVRCGNQSCAQCDKTAAALSSAKALDIEPTPNP